jgi:ATP-binding cassette, subfamily C (CFTR/MRP), member 4
MRLSSYQVKDANLGKIINLISNDLITAEMRLMILMFSFCFPINIIISSVIIVIRLSWVGLISVAILLSYIYIQKRIG